MHFCAGRLNRASEPFGQTIRFLSVVLLHFTCARSGRTAASVPLGYQGAAHVDVIVHTPGVSGPGFPVAIAHRQASEVVLVVRLVV